ncbi:hypothetical protein POTOM_060787 [Populus tomentosa]|uniref:Uncharacterized protein n=1 Tax=Populus tomentosa TaxID=118781 RepID=A0A8X7XRM9_POPTO|nr:hypothetical protein POTOM_060787 [Populus tomentosa]
MATSRKQSESLLSLIRPIRSHKESACHLTMVLASKAPFVLDPCILKQYSHDRSRVIHISHPNKRILVAACDIHLANTSSTSKDSPGGKSLMTPASALASVTACIVGIFCTPGASALTHHEVISLMIGVIGVMLLLSSQFPLCLAHLKPTGSLQIACDVDPLGCNMGFYTPCVYCKFSMLIDDGACLSLADLDANSGCYYICWLVSLLLLYAAWSESACLSRSLLWILTVWINASLSASGDSSFAPYLSYCCPSLHGKNVVSTLLLGLEGDSNTVGF